MIRFLLYFFIIVFSFSIMKSYSGDTTIANIKKVNELPRNYIGISASSFSSLGISYHYLLGKTKSIGLKFTLLMYPNNDDLQMWIFYGGEFQINFLKNDYFRVYLLFGANYYGPLNSDSESKLYFGTGAGVEFVIAKSFAINLDCGSIFYYKHKEFYRYYDNYQWVRDYNDKLQVGLGLGLGLSYAF